MESQQTGHSQTSLKLSEDLQQIECWAATWYRDTSFNHKHNRFCCLSDFMVVGATEDIVNCRAIGGYLPVWLRLEWWQKISMDACDVILLSDRLWTTKENCPDWIKPCFIPSEVMVMPEAIHQFPSSSPPFDTGECQQQFINIWAILSEQSCPFHNLDHVIRCERGNCVVGSVKQTLLQPRKDRSYIIAHTCQRILQS